MTTEAAPKPKYDWYQTESLVVITILVKNLKQEDVKVATTEKTLNVAAKLPTGNDYTLELHLSHPVDPNHVIVKVMSTKVEIKLKKTEAIQWKKLEGEEEQVKHFTPEPGAAAVKQYPSSSHHTRDWDKLVHDIKEEEKEEKPEGDAALQELFKKIYSDGSDEVRKAMNKSFMESGGTVLSTNWEDIAKKKTEIKPPDGMEYKEFD